MSRKIIDMNKAKRSPEELAAYKTGFEQGVMLAIGSIESNREHLPSATETFKDGMDYAVHCIEMNADSFRKLTGDLWTGKEQKS